MTNQAGKKTNQPQPEKAPARARVIGFPDVLDEMDRFWDTFAPRWRPFGASNRGQIAPAMDVYEKDGRLHVQTELPGLAAEDIAIEVDDNALTISGEKQDRREVKEENYYRSERSYGRFTRQVALPAGADTENIEAKFVDGVLDIEVPIKMVEPEKKKKIAIK
jgi:HSP20 family protein